MSRKKYYVHALLYLWGGRERLGPYRWFWLARLKAGSLMAKYPYGTAVINQDPVTPPIVRG